MPPNQSRSTGALTMAAMISAGRGRSANAKQLQRLGRKRDIFLAPAIDAAAFGDLGAVVVLPARTRQIEQALPLFEACGGVRIGVDEDVAVVEGRDELDRLRQQHAVAEHVARHVADARDRERRRLDVDVHLAEMALHRFPGASRGDAHALVVVARRAAARERVAQPEIAAERDPVGDVGEGGGALVGGDDEVRIVAIAPDRRGRAARFRP